MTLHVVCCSLLTILCVSVVVASFQVNVDLSSDRHPVSDGVYGVNGIPADMLNGHLVGATRMGGGDPTTVYNWRIDADNAGYDWYFSQRPRAPDGQNSADNYVQVNFDADSVAIVDVSIVGWVAVSRSTDCYSFPVKQFPGQARALGDMGCGVYPNGTGVAQIHGPQLKCYTPSGPSDIVDFVTHLRDTFGGDKFDANGIIQFDNEPEWWVAQHEDVHPKPFTYDEVWNKTSAHAAAIKAKYPNTRIMALVAGGWYGMWCSGIDGGGWHCPPNGVDYRSHDNMYFWPWILKQVNDYKLRTGVQLIDIVDWHWYTDGGINDDSDPKKSAELLSQTRNLYDPTYIDMTGLTNPSNGSNSPAIIPLVYSWIKNFAPNCTINTAITEWNYGGDKLNTAALAVAEAMSIMGREGLTYSTRFNYGSIGSPCHQSYLFYRNYDGKGSRVSGDSIRAVITDTDPDILTVYAQHNTSSSQLFIKLFYKDPNNNNNIININIINIRLDSSMINGEMYQFQAVYGGTVQLGYVGNIMLTMNGRVATANITNIPIRTATLIVFNGVHQDQSHSLIVQAE